MNKTGVDDKAFSEIKGKGFFICLKLRKGVTLNVGRKEENKRKDYCKL